MIYDRNQKTILESYLVSSVGWRNKTWLVWNGMGIKGQECKPTRKEQDEMKREKNEMKEKNELKKWNDRIFQKYTRKRGLSYTQTHRQNQFRGEKL